MKNDELNDANAMRLVHRTEARLEQANAELATLRHQPLDPYVLDKVIRAEREAERWSRITAALERNAPPLGLVEDPGSVVARVLGGIREDWRGTGLEVASSFRRLAPRRFDRRAYLEALRVVADLLLSSFETPRRIEGRIEVDDNELAFVLIVEGSELSFRSEDAWAGGFLVERSGGELRVDAQSRRITARIVLGEPTAEAEEAPSREYVFPLEPLEMAQ